MAQNTPDFLSPEYLLHQGQLEVVNDVYDGIDTAKAHLQQYNKETLEDYTQRQDVATLNNFVFRSVDSIKNIVFRRTLNKTELEGTAIEPLIDNIDLSQSLDSFAKDVLVASQLDGYCFILADAPIYSEDIQTRADELAKGLVPYLNLVKRTNVPNCKINEQGKYDRITIRETYEVENGSFGYEVKVQYRVYYKGGLIETWRDGKVVPNMTVEANFDDIPIVKVFIDDTPPMYDLAKLNVNHMNRTSELNSYIRAAGAPIPVMWGGSNDGKLQVVGVNQGISFSGTPQEADFQWRELSGHNAAIIREQIKLDEEAMLDIIVSLVTSNQPRTATEVNSDNTENTAKLTHAAQVVEEGINKALKLLGDFMNTKITAEIEVNKDFDSNRLTPEQVREYRNDYVQGIISLDRLMEVLVEGEVYTEMTEQEWTAEKAKLVDNGDL
jgi:hypothetical protein